MQTLYDSWIVFPVAQAANTQSTDAALTGTRPPAPGRT